jgi:hypothetical protein
MALARPDRRVVVLEGDGSLLMNLGTLATDFVAIARAVARRCSCSPRPSTGERSIPPYSERPAEIRVNFARALQRVRPT